MRSHGTTQNTFKWYNDWIDSLVPKGRLPRTGAAWHGVTFGYVPIFQYTKEVYTNWIQVRVHLFVAQYIILHLCATQGAYRNGASVYICTCGLIEYGASENVTPVHKHPCVLRPVYRVRQWRLLWLMINLLPRGCSYRSNLQCECARCYGILRHHLVTSMVTKPLAIYFFKQFFATWFFFIWSQLDLLWNTCNNHVKDWLRTSHIWSVTTHGLW